MTASLRRRLFLATLILTASSAFGQVKYQLVLPEVVQQRLDLYQGDDTLREDSLLKLFAQAGCPSVNLSQQPVPHRKQPNVICVLRGSSPDIVVVGAHFDHIRRGDGIVDNWSGASLLPSLFQALAAAPRKHTFVFIGFSGEESGLRGSQWYVQQLTKEQLLKTKAMINLDSLGLGPTEIWVSQSDPLLVNELVVVAHSLKVPISGMNMDGVGESDEESFIGKKVCTLTVHSITPQTLHVLHSRSDNPAAMRFRDYYDTYRLLADFLANLDNATRIGDHVCTAKPI